MGPQSLFSPTNTKKSSLLPHTYLSTFQESTSPPHPAAQGSASLRIAAHSSTLHRMAPRTVPPTPLTSLTIDSRCGRRKFTARRPSGEAAYFIVAPPTWAATSGDHHKTYLALVYRGDNPKYNPTSQLVGMVRRGTWWKTVTQTLHGAVARDAKVLEKETLTRKLKIKNRCRKLVCMGAKRLEWEEGCESLQPVQDYGSQVVMTHTGHRRYTVEVEGVEYRLTGTRMYGWQKKVKGCALSTKVFVPGFFPHWREEGCADRTAVGEGP